jgi:ribokinase
MTNIYCLGSLNLDYVYRVQSIVRPGETIMAQGSNTHFGGKGANQSIALARAGANVFHVGMIGPDGTELLKNLQTNHVDSKYVQISSNRTGHAIIQVQESGENSIIVESGANGAIPHELITEALGHAVSGDWLLTQNETNLIEWTIGYAKERGMKVAYNPSPFDRATADEVLDSIDLLILNKSEGQALTEQEEPNQILDAIFKRNNSVEVVITLGDLGAYYATSSSKIFEPAIKVAAIDTTAAGDTFLGYFIGSRIANLSPSESLQRATKAASICVTRVGAANSIPLLSEI